MTVTIGKVPFISGVYPQTEQAFMWDTKPKNILLKPMQSVLGLLSNAEHLVKKQR